MLKVKDMNQLEKFGFIDVRSLKKKTAYYKSYPNDFDGWSAYIRVDHDRKLRVEVINLLTPLDDLFALFNAGLIEQVSEDGKN